MSWIDDVASAWEREYPARNVGSLPPMVRLARLAILLDAFQVEITQRFDLTPSDYGVLAALRRAGSPYELSPTRLTNRLHRSSGGMTKMLNRLEERGLVRRTPDPDDGRGSRVRLTRAGVALQQRVFDAFLAATDELLAPLGPRRMRAVDEALALLLDTFESWVEAEDAA